MINLKAVGDINLQTQNYVNPFGLVDTVLSEKDLLFGNLETVLSDEGEFAKKAVPISSPSESVQWLKKAGFDIVNIANNHIIDRSGHGLINTIKCLESTGIHHIGVLSSSNKKNYSIIEKNGTKFGFLGYTTGRFKNPELFRINRVKTFTIVNDINDIKGKCDTIIVSLHWGIENVHYPSPDQIKMAHDLIDAGATIIIGHHPHVLQGIEKYNGGVIAYSLGNFQFSPELSQSISNDSIILSIDIEKNKIFRYSVIPVIINSDYQPDNPTDTEKEKIVLLLKTISEPIISNKINKKWWFEQISETYLQNNLNSYRKRVRSHGLLPFFECCIWLITPFCINCYLSIFRRILNGK